MFRCKFTCRSQTYAIFTILWLCLIGLQFTRHYHYPAIWAFSWISSVPPSKFWSITPTRPRPLHSRSLSFQPSPDIQPFDAVLWQYRQRHTNWQKRGRSEGMLHCPLHSTSSSDCRRDVDEFQPGSSQQFIVYCCQTISTIHTTLILVMVFPTYRV